MLVIAPCGFDVERTQRELARLTEREGYAELSAVRAGRVFAARRELVHAAIGDAARHRNRDLGALSERRGSRCSEAR